MEVSISARHGSLSANDQAYIEKKLPKLVHLFERLTSINVTVDFQNSEPEVELIVSAEHKNGFVAKEHHANVTAAFDNAIAKMEGQIRRYKDKIQDHHRKGPSISGEGAGLMSGDNE